MAVKLQWMGGRSRFRCSVGFGRFTLLNSAVELINFNREDRWKMVADSLNRDRLAGNRPSPATKNPLKLASG